MFLQVQPILGTRDMPPAVAFYVGKLGFALAFQAGESEGAANYVGFRRDGVEIHMQFQYPHEMGTTRLRLFVTEVDGLLAEFLGKGVVVGNPMRDTPWGTREFALYDPDGNSLTFYRHLKKG